jgi:hypothetical protein
MAARELGASRRRPVGPHRHRCAGGRRRPGGGRTGPPRPARSRSRARAAVSGDLHPPPPRAALDGRPRRRPSGLGRGRPRRTRPLWRPRRRPGLGQLRATVSRLRRATRTRSGLTGADWSRLGRGALEDVPRRRLSAAGARCRGDAPGPTGLGRPRVRISPFRQRPFCLRRGSKCQYPRPLHLRSGRTPSVSSTARIVLASGRQATAWRRNHETIERRPRQQRDLSPRAPAHVGEAGALHVARAGNSARRRAETCNAPADALSAR